MQRPRRRATATLLIDAMGTLITLRDPVAALCDELSRRFGLAVAPAQARAALGAEIAYYRAHMDEGVDERSLAALREQCARVLTAELPALASPAPSAAVMTEVLLASLRFEPFPEAADMLRRVRAAGSRIVVVSNWDVSLAAALEQTGLAPLLDGVLTSAAIGAPKPAPAIFTAALALAGARPQDAVHVGDSLEADVAGAQALGIRPVLVDRSPVPLASSDLEVITSLDQLAWPPGR